MAHISSLSPPYQEGNTLTLNFITKDLLAPYTLEVKITRLFEPSTLSSVMEVDVLHSSGPAGYPNHAVLKLYDRRYATQLRSDNKIPPWTQSLEDQYRELVQSGEAAKFIASLEDDTSTDGQSWDAGQDEAFLFDFCRDLYDCETEAYRRLEDLQGRHVPKLFAHVRLSVWPGSDPPPADIQVFFEVPGILMEHIEGCNLSEITEHTPSSSWQSICEEAIRVVNLISDHEILNEDIKTRNVLVREKGEEGGCGGYEVVFIDFGHVRFRGPDQSEEDWMHEKSVQDEEGAIGAVMEKKLHGSFKYQPSYRFDCRCSRCTEL